jgi:histidine triad (HIT) family protein
MCVFCEIAQGALPAHFVYENDTCIAFLDKRPLFPGHSLVIPRRHHETFADLPSDLIEPLFGAVRLLSGAVERGLDAKGAFIAINNKVSQSVPHFHVHVVPRRPKDGLRGFFWPRRPYLSDDEAEDVARRIRTALEEHK